MSDEPSSAEWVRVPTPRWMAQLKGDDWVLQELARHFGGQPITIARSDKTWWIGSEQFEALATASDVHDVGQQLVSILLAIARTRVGIARDIELAGLFLERLDGGRQQQHWIKGEQFLVYPRGHPELAGKRDDRSWEADVRAAESDWRVSRVLAFLAAPRSWQSLYAAFEIVIKDGRVGKRPGVVAKGWATDDEIERFKETANDFGAVGPYARHGWQRQVVKDPLPQMEAESLVYRLVRCWLDELGEETQR